MKNVIEIPDNLYESAKSGRIEPWEITVGMCKLIADSTPLEKVFDDIKTEIKNYDQFILCANGQKGIHIDAALAIIDKYTNGKGEEE